MQFGIFWQDIRARSHHKVLSDQSWMHHSLHPFDILMINCLRTCFFCLVISSLVPTRQGQSNVENIPCHLSFSWIAWAWKQMETEMKQKLETETGNRWKRIIMDHHGRCSKNLLALLCSTSICTICTWELTVLFAAPVGETEAEGLKSFWNHFGGNDKVFLFFCILCVKSFCILLVSFGLGMAGWP